MKLREIERLRAVAALLVVCVHWPPLHRLLPAVLDDPWSGVDLFFVISGYVVTLSLVRLLPAVDEQPGFLGAFDVARPGLKTFYARRFFRIMPAALTVALASRVMAGLFPDQFGTTSDWLKEFFAFFGGIYNYLFAFGNFPCHLNVYWSLSVEEHFYLLLPVLFLVFRTRNRRLAACVAVAAFSILSRSVFHPDSKAGVEWDPDFYCSHNRFDSLMAGVAIALVASHLKSAAAPVMPPRLMRWGILPMALVILACLPGSAPKYVLEHAGFVSLWMLGGLLVWYASMDRGYVLAVPGLGRALEYVGARSYSLYLTHQLVFRLESAERWFWPEYARLTPNSDLPWARILALLLATWAVTEILYRTIEQPFIRLGRRILDAGGGYSLSRTARWLMPLGLALLAIAYFRHPLMLALGGPDLARGKAVTQSSHQDGTPGPRALVDGQLESGVGTQTQSDDRPWMKIDLGAPTPIGAIRVYNRDDGSQDASFPLEIQISDDDEHWKAIARRDLMFTQQWPWRLDCGATRARYVRLMAMKTTVLGLSEVEMFTSPDMAHVP